ncbi:GtrA family protein [Lactiplantibacillus pentosus]|uniref:GtrA family protein n=1 Tax=Lactiplantibacillus pentosus TaxID=1589 RepID=A0AAX6LC74_LACPE|nr:GtrA family protein [Lactiplantibacillus pentosus]MDF2312148.1 GtrA family protein [Lactiplantibacillus pentosus]
MQWLIKIYHRGEYFWKYAVFGFMAALINVLAFWLLHAVLVEHYLFSNTIAWIVATLFSFFTNKAVVFQSKSQNFWHWCREFVSFMLTRGLSYFFDTFLMFLGISVLIWPAMLVKIIDQVLVGLFNYGTSRLIFMESNQKMRMRRMLLKRLNNRNN